MKITEIKTFCCHDGKRKYFIVKVETDAGISGLGEVGIADWGAAVEQAVKHLRDTLIGDDPFATERHWQRMFRGWFFPADRVYGCAISAIDIALWDIKGKALGLPVYRLLGGPVRDEVVCYAHIEGRDGDELVADCRAHLAAGWKFLRWPVDIRAGERDVLEPSEAVRDAVRHMAAVREAIGDEPELCLDVHTRLGMAHTIDLCRRLEPYRPFFIEDPLRPENAASYRTLARHVRLPIAAGEQWTSKWAFREVIEEELINYARIDLCIVGGLTEALKIAHWCETHYIDIVPHNPLGPVSARRGGRAMHGDHQRRRAGDATRTGHVRHRPVPAADPVGRRLRPLS